MVTLTIELIDDNVEDKGFISKSAATSVHPSIQPPICPFAHPSDSQSVSPPIRRSVHPSPPVCPSVRSDDFVSTTIFLGMFSFSLLGYFLDSICLAFCHFGILLHNFTGPINVNFLALLLIYVELKEQVWSTNRCVLSTYFLSATEYFPSRTIIQPGWVSSLSLLSSFHFFAMG